MESTSVKSPQEKAACPTEWPSSQVEWFRFDSLATRHITKGGS